MMLVFRTVNEEPAALVSASSFDTVEACRTGSKAAHDALFDRDLEEKYRVICTGPQGEFDFE